MKTEETLLRLLSEGPLSPPALALRAGRSERMVRIALRRLERAGLVRVRMDLRDLRRRTYAAAG